MLRKLLVAGLVSGAAVGAYHASAPAQAATETPKVIYFGKKGGAEVTRLLLELGHKQYDDVYVKTTDDAKKLGKLMYGQLPVLKYNGEMLSQSQAINRFLARELGFYGKSSWEAARIDEVCEGLIDFRLSFFFPLFRTPAEEKEKYIEKYKNESLKKHLDNFEAIAQANGGKGFFIGNKFSLADVFAYNVLTETERLIPGALNTYPGLKAIQQNIDRQPEVVKHNQTKNT